MSTSYSLQNKNFLPVYTMKSWNEHLSVITQQLISSNRHITRATGQNRNV